MCVNNRVVDRFGKSAPEAQSSGKSTGLENVKNIIADKVRNVAEAIGEKAAHQDAQSDIAQYGKQASEWLEQSAEYVRDFDYEQAVAKARESVKQSPGRSLLIAGAVGLILGAVLRRR